MLANITTVGVVSLACLLVLSGDAFAIKGNSSAGRDATMQRCMEEARTHYKGGPVAGADQPRYFAYLACMRNAGFTEYYRYHGR